jgi:hypothetical protein
MLTLVKECCKKFEVSLHICCCISWLTCIYLFIYLFMYFVYELCFTNTLYLCCPHISSYWCFSTINLIS